ncbi:MAG TPA: PepSY domain-containing protein [Candidatus Nanopelagicales bacterium]|nr:PepSY domain-containing protein [Candidatus Nanopelagicales bacterium]
MIDHETTTSTRSSAKRWGSAAALLAAGLAGGIVIAGTVSANAATSSPSPSASSGSTSGSAPTGSGQGQKPAETALTGDTAAKVRAAALAKYPGATVDRVETDSDGVYEAHLTTTDGTHVTVEVDASFTVTGTEQGHGGRGGDGGPGKGETALSGTTADKVKAAALATYPGATVERLETDSDGVYEAHLTTTDGTHVIVAVGKDFTVTGTQDMPAGGGHGGPGDQTGQPAPSRSSTA